MFSLIFGFAQFSFSQDTTGLRFNQKSLTEIKMGKENDHVKFLQKSLYDFGYYLSEEDEPEFSGKFEKDLELALKDFQKTNELKVTGRVDQVTLKTLNEFLEFQEESAEEEVVPEEPINAFMDEKDDISQTLKLEEVAYFDEDDVTDLYAKGPKGTGALKEVLSKATAPGILSTGKKTDNKEEKKESFIQSWIGSFKKLFMPSTYFKDSARTKYEQEINSEVAKSKQSPAEKFKDYDFFECSQDDECMEALNSANKKSK